jgi:hypothetical protein
LQCLRWQTVADVLAAGAHRSNAPPAMGLPEEPPETVSARLKAWATDQFEHGLLPEDDHQRILALASPRAPTSRCSASRTSSDPPASSRTTRHRTRRERRRSPGGENVRMTG